MTQTETPTETRATHTYIGPRVFGSRGALPHGWPVRIERRAAQGEHTIMVRLVDPDGTLGSAFYVNEGEVQPIE